MITKKLQIHSTPLSGVMLVETQPYYDERGFFYRAFCEQELEEILCGRVIRQVNLSMTKQAGTVRGLHFQYPPYTEMKMIRCIKGCVWDVVVDLRRSSTTFLKWYGVELSAENKQMLIVPEGFAHGFQVLTDESQLLYFHTQSYVHNSEGGVRYNDPMLKIFWPLPVTRISERDCSYSLLTDEYQGITI